MIERHFDKVDGILFVRGTGVWTREEIDAHYEHLRVLLTGLRAQGRPVRVLIDGTEAAQPSPELEAYIREQSERNYRPGDRVAILVAPGDDRQYARALVKGTQIGAFTSRMAAEMWLMEESLPPPS